MMVLVVNTFMFGNDYSKSQHDSYIYLRKVLGGSFVYFVIYVDEKFITTKNMSEINKLKAQLNGEFEMKHLGETKIHWV